VGRGRNLTGPTYGHKMQLATIAAAPAYSCCRERPVHTKHAQKPAVHQAPSTEGGVADVSILRTALRPNDDLEPLVG